MPFDERGGPTPVQLSSLSAARCVVTGGLGFIGSNLVHALTDAGAVVTVVDALIESHGGSLHNVEGAGAAVVVAEIGDPVVAEVVRDADVVFNLAGQVSHVDSMRDPLLDLRLNVTSHAALLMMLREVNPSARVVHTSTRQVYGVPVRSPVDEDHRTRPVDVNGVAKLAGEQLHMVYAHAHDLPITSLRLTNVFGPRQRLNSDVLGFLPVFIRQALLGQEIRIYGDGTQRRDCVHVDDVVTALVAATSERTAGQVFNIGQRRDASLAALAEMIVAAAGGESRITFVPWPEESLRIDIGSFRTDSTRFTSVAGWCPTVELETGFATTAAFYRGDPWYLSST